MREPLQSIYLKTHALRFKHTNVGLDMFPEMVNKAIREGVEAHVTRDRITNFVNQLTFTSLVADGLNAVGAHHPKPKTIKNSDPDVNTIKEFLSERLGRTWGAVTTPSQANLLDLNLEKWGVRADRMAAHMPWVRAPVANADMAEYVQKELQKLCHWHNWAP